jgi:hypothetical protein
MAYTARGNVYKHLGKHDNSINDYTKSEELKQKLTIDEMINKVAQL